MTPSSRCGPFRSRCKTVMKTVATHLLNTNLDQRDLPCLQTAINVADEGHILTKFQTAEKMQAVENFTLHTDGTSRNGKKIVGHQIRKVEKHSASVPQQLPLRIHQHFLMSLFSSCRKSRTFMVQTCPRKREIKFSSLCCQSLRV